MNTKKRVQTKTKAVDGLGHDRFGFRKDLRTRDAVEALRAGLLAEAVLMKAFLLKWKRNRRKECCLNRSRNADRFLC